MIPMLALSAAGPIAGLVGKLFAPQPKPQPVVISPAQFDAQLKAARAANGAQFPLLSPTEQESLARSLMGKQVRIQTSDGQEISGVMNNLRWHGTGWIAQVGGREVESSRIQQLLAV